MHYYHIIKLYFPSLPVGVTHDDILQEIEGSNMYFDKNNQHFEIVLKNGFIAKGACKRMRSNPQYLNASNVDEIAAGVFAYQKLIDIFEYKQYQKKYGKES